MAAEDYFDFDADPSEMQDEPTWPQFDRLARAAFGSRSGPSSRSGLPWGALEDRQLRDQTHCRLDLGHIAKTHARTELAILCRMYSLLIGEGVYWAHVSNPDGRFPFVRIWPMNRPDAKTSSPALSFTIQTKSAMTAHDNLILTLLQQDYTTVEVKFQGGGPTYNYTYKVSNDVAKTLAEGDALVVPAGDENRLKVVTVKKVHSEPEIDVHAPYAFKWVVCKVDRTAYDEQVRREKEALDLLKKAERAAAKRKAVEALMGGEGGDVLTKVQRLLSGQSDEIPE